MSQHPLSVRLRFVAPETAVRRGEPVTVGLPWPRGAIRDERCFHLLGPDGTPRGLQPKVLDRWPDGSVRWALFDFLATVDGLNDGYRVAVAPEPAATTTPAARPSPAAEELGIHFGQSIEQFPIDAGASLEVKLRGCAEPVRLNFAPLVEEAGPIRIRLQATATNSPHPSLLFSVRWESTPGNPVMRLQVTVRNSAAAEHPGGNWDLGNGGSVDLERFSLVMKIRGEPTPGTARISRERGQPFEEAPTVELTQHSSGGDHWRSENHLTRHRTIPFNQRGYTWSGGSPSLRATPVVTLSAGDRCAGATMPEFWENFPKRIAAGEGQLVLDLFPVGETELQGGEQKTHTVFVAFGKDTVTVEPMIWCRSPLRCHADPEWYAASGAIPYLTPRANDPTAAYLALVDQAIEGPNTFLHKREVIDEYGWRHFGDLYGDHEAVDWPGPEPMVSHYNNQYDCIAGFLYQFLRSGDTRWWSQAIECADHTCDIDVYHTDGDKAAYNHGLFWHTYHYAPADTGTHRSYPKSLRRGPQASTTTKMDTLGATAEKLKKSYAVGGGPAASHNYNRGLMLAYFLTGNPLYRDAAIGLARFVIDMDDPAKTVFRWLSREYTGLATESGGDGYHGPGRASANSVEALLVGHQITGERAFLDKAEQIIRRVSHPMQDFDRLDLLNAELRWFYTLFLQALGRYLDYKIELGELDQMYAYGRLTLLHYARWMAIHERPILDAPERLQYPNETWPAQDMRKTEVFQYAAKHAEGAERLQFLERADWFFRYVERTLTGFPSKALCRPVVLMMNVGWSRAWWQRNPDAVAPPPRESLGEPGEWRMFVPQKTIALRRAKRLAVWTAVGCALVGIGLLAWLAGR